MITLLRGADYSQLYKNTEIVYVDSDGLLHTTGKGNILDYSSILTELKSNTALAAGNNDLNGTACPASEIWTVEQIAFLYNGTTLGVKLDLYLVRAGGAYPIMEVQASCNSNYWYTVNGLWTLYDSDYLRIACSNATLNDDLFLRYFGFRANVL